MTREWVKEGELETQVFISLRNKLVKIQLKTGGTYSGKLSGIYARDRRIVLSNITIHLKSNEGKEVYIHSKQKESRRFNMCSIKSIQSFSWPSLIQNKE